MEIFYINERPAALPAAVAPLSAAPATARPCVPQLHRVETQAELILAPAVTVVQGSSGFTGKDVDVVKRRTDVRGVPPRGRPV
ncbi:hypothetical protein QTQ03_13995 [Micromonospora sp. WMMA1363]|uniref:hypothetical protein n=1 Tax=Micromonospora sp. WMMA1363 TaxID=3053985 RepID=UPI00259CC191|nr:hypothetical protein [Micromonospora sp. WMMA1363]MDM4720640.1 hypothetical protein [Micromonospora sp. WMMA1363]